MEKKKTKKRKNMRFGKKDEKEIKQKGKIKRKDLN